MTDRKAITDLYVRLCRDSNFSLDAIRAAQLTASVLKLHPLEVWLAMPSMSVTELVASGNHPACKEISP